MVYFNIYKYNIYFKLIYLSLIYILINYPILINVFISEKIHVGLIYINDQVTA